MPLPHVLIAGAGWLGLPLADTLVQSGFEVTATRRGEAGLAAVAAIGATPMALELEGEIASLPRADVMVICLPPGRQADAAPYHQRLQPLLDAAVEAGITRVIFTSATSVYGHCCGWVDEQSCVDSGERAARMLDAERAVRRHFPAANILRLAGLVGGERHPGRFLAGKQGMPGGADPVNLVHRDDVVAAIKALILSPLEGQLFNLASPHHPTRQEYYRHCARLLALPQPRFDPGFHQPRWISGAKIAGALGWRYRHTDLYGLPELIR